VAFAGLCSAGGLGGYMEQSMKEYAHYKVQEDCFGKEVVVQYHKEMMEASRKCTVEGYYGNGTDLLDFQDIINEIRAAALRYDPEENAGQSYKLVPVLINGRYRRAADNSAAEQLAELKEKMVYKITNVTCMLKELKYMNDDKTPNYEHFEKYINKIDDAFLRNNLHYGYDMCKEFSECMPVTKAKTMIMQELGTCISFFKCMEMKKMEACFKKDFREAMHDYGFDAVEEKINMGLEMMGEEVHREGMDAYETLEMAMMGNMF